MANELQTTLNEILADKQTNLKPENLKKGVTLLGVEGNLESGGSTEVPVKLFETQEEMQADVTAQEGDLAVVYRSEVQNMTADSEVTSITFPETVTLPAAFTDDVYCMLRAVDSSAMFDGNCELSQNSFHFEGYSDTGMIRVRYTSEDGITYTRTRFQGDSGDLTNPVDLGTTVKVEQTEEWNDNLGYFMQTGGNVFEGLFQYKHHALDNVYNASNYTNKTKLNINYKIPDIIAKIDKGDPKQLIIVEESELDKSGYYYNIKKCKTYHPVGTNRPFIGITADNKYYICFEMYNKDSSTTIEQIETNYDFSLDNPVVSTVNITKSDADKLPIFGNRSNGISTGSDTYYILKEIQANQTNIVSIAGPNMITTSLTSSQLGKGVTIITAPSSVYKSELIYIDSYMPASTQLTTVANDVYKSIFFGKNGLETGILSENISNSFADTSAIIYTKVRQAYDNMSPRVLTDNDKTIDKNIQIIPTNSKGQALLDTSAVTNMGLMFYSCTNLTEIPLLDTSSVTSMSDMFNGCTNLTTISQLNTSSVTDMGSMFAYCSSLTTIPLLDTSSVTNMGNMFNKCTNLTEIPLLDTSNVISMSAMFNGCTSLVNLPLLASSKVTDFYHTFYKCTSLSDESLNNILAMCANTTNHVSTKTLSYIGLTSDQATKCTTLSNYSAFTAAGWTTGY